MTTKKSICIKCDDRSLAICTGCSQDFCRTHWFEHEQDLSQQLVSFESFHDHLREKLNQEKTHPIESPGIKAINKWEEDLIRKIQQRAKELRQMLVRHRTQTIDETNIDLMRLTGQIRDIRQRNVFNEIDLDEIKDNFERLQNKFNKLLRVSFQPDSTPCLGQISVLESSDHLYTSIDLRINPQWNPHGLTIAGGNGKGDERNQLHCPHGIYVDDDNHTVYIADTKNDRIVQWNYGATHGQIVAAGNGQGDQTNRLKHPVSVVMNTRNDSMIVCDRWHDRVVSWSYHNSMKQDTVIPNIQCWGVSVDMAGDLYVSDTNRHEVRRWRLRERSGKVVAGGYGAGNGLNQLHHPTYIFIDQEYSVYVSDSKNDRVMKWKRDAEEGNVVAGGNGKGDSLMQLDNPQGVLVDHLGNVYVADHGNHRVVCWPSGSQIGRIVVGSNGKGNQANQFNGIGGLAFDREENLFVVDHENHRVQKFNINSH